MIQDTVLTTRETSKRKSDAVQSLTAGTSEIASDLNRLLAGYSVFYQKLLAFHWAVEGKDFFDVHEKLEADYVQAQSDIDMIAERVRILGHMPLFTLAEMLKHSTIEEAQLPLSAAGMITQVMRDQELLVGQMMDVAATAKAANDMGTEDLAISLIRKFEKRHWMYRSWLEA